MDRPTVALYSKCDGVSLRLVESLISNICRVLILSTQKNLWEESLVHIKQRNFFALVDPKKEFVEFKYLIVVNLDLKFSAAEIIEVSTLAAAQSAKILVMLPFVTENKKAWQERESLRNLILKKIPEAGIVFAGEIYGPRYFGEEKNYVARSIASATLNRQIEAADEAVLYPITVEAFCRWVSRNLFSFGPYGKEVAVYSEEITNLEFLNLLQEYEGDISFISSKVQRQEVSGINKQLVKSDLRQGVKETANWLKESGLIGDADRKRKSNFYFLKIGAILGLFILLLSPFILGGLGGIFGLMSFASFRNGKVNTGQKSLGLAQFSLQNADEFFSVFAQLPLISVAYKPFAPPARVLALTAEVGRQGFDIAQKAKRLSDSVLGDEVYDPVPPSQEISVALTRLYETTGFLAGEYKNLSPTAKGLLKKILTESLLEEVRPKILGAKALAENASVILGTKGPKTYLLLFQNNMELRPTGGFIGSFALITLDSGRLVDINVMDVYAADGQLKGHVEPPAPIKKYLGEANWFLRDSNWDPDFPTSAARAEWFLDKEIDKQVDGVFAIDLEVVKDFLEVTGPVILADFNQVFDYKNLYERLQSEVEDEFFPGSQKKASILTALAKELTARLSELGGDKYVPTFTQFAKNLEERHIQIYFNDAILQSSIEQLGYAGAFKVPVCSEDCFADFISVVDANVGVTKANYFIQRSFNLDVVIAQGVAKKTLEITYKNTANIALAQAARYRTYTRVFATPGSVFQKVKIDNAGDEVEAEADLETFDGRMSAGINIEVSPQQTKKLIFSWQTPITGTVDSGEYLLMVKKQAGTEDDPLLFSILTPQEAEGYNTSLTRDFFARINF